MTDNKSPVEPNTALEEDQTATKDEEEELPSNRFELELEFLQSLASPAYIHFLATNALEDGGSLADLQPFLRYLRDTYTRPDYVRFIQYPQALFFLDLLIEQPNVLKEWTVLEFRDFCHQQQFLAWQHRHATCYGVGKVVATTNDPPPEESANDTTNTEPSNAEATS